MKKTEQSKKELEEKKMEKKKFKNASEAYAEYRDISSDARQLLTCGPNPQHPDYTGKDIPEVLELFEEWKIEEAGRISKRYDAWYDAVCDCIDDITEWDELMRDCDEDPDLYKVIRMADGED